MQSTGWSVSIRQSSIGDGFVVASCRHLILRAVITFVGITNVGHDRTQLANMAKQAKSVLERDELKVVADRGYYSGKEIDRYYASSLVCGECPQKANCTNGKERRVCRWEHEHVLEELDKRMTNEPEQMGVRRSTVEHPLGTIKTWIGHTHFQMKTIARVSTEMSLHVLSYNLKCVINIMGVENLIKAMAA